MIFLRTEGGESVWGGRHCGGGGKDPGGHYVSDTMSTK